MIQLQSAGLRHGVVAELIRPCLGAPSASIHPRIEPRSAVHHMNSGRIMNAQALIHDPPQIHGELLPVDVRWLRVVADISVRQETRVLENFETLITRFQSHRLSPRCPHSVRSEIQFGQPESERRMSRMSGWCGRGSWGDGPDIRESGPAAVLHETQSEAAIRGGCP
jgi:hypothetical protein